MPAKQYSADSKTDSLLTKRHVLTCPITPDTLRSRLKVYKQNTKIGSKIKSLTRIVKQNHTSHTLRQHRRIWESEYERLETSRTALERSAHDALRTFLSLSDPHESLHTMTEIIDTIQDLDTDREEWFKSLSTPVMTTVKCLKSAKDPIRRKECLELLKSTQHGIEQRQQELITQLSTLDTPDTTKSPYEDLDDLILNPWTEYAGHIAPFLDIPCIDLGIQEQQRSIYKEFLDTFYTRLQDLRDAAGTDHLVHLDPSNRLRIRKIVQEYMATTHPHRWTLCLDRCSIELPQLDRNVIQSHALHIHQTLHTPSTLKSLKTTLQTTLTQHISDTLTLYTQATIDHHRALVAEQETQDRMERLEDLHARVRTWRHQKMEQIRHDMRVEEIRLRNQEEQRLLLEEQTRQTRQKTQEMLKTYHTKKHQTLLSQIQTSLDLQEAYTIETLHRIQYNQTRIHHRQTLQTQKQLSKAHQTRQTHLESLKLQARLDALRATVAVQAQSDWTRIWGNTEAWTHFLKAEKSKPLYNIPGYTSQDLLKDPRHKLSLAFADHGLSSTPYARSMLCSMVREPLRADQKSVIRLG
ncbi:uncharacterized protein SPPG_06945 [Spizellomyces punctatus DAOM BR117]|uniref:Uncharacterized protein n=1 Tax=Spizellomyces punctatus (strain DAOM BR117) TaxID=645134 RepID=A0A0L0H9U4_SPIPD|nr:uncharacterized protein SPPG_06945 [Spizellomyces punctatus DAOM BR117]KNC97957.1 hypothetical protein SPPG_06945 [Spizellomyces punctatus DAOM BR117]|eukprot:XP_016605997.1 hypothetical protein SPPG_06945 [Spizellomyces punctatus DAOM BR117]